MTAFEDALWAELVSDHGAELLGIGPRARARARSSWRLPMAAGGTALIVAVVVAGLTVTAGTSPPAYALVVNPNGSVTLTINELIGVTGANAQLARLGVRARVAQLEAHCSGRGHFIRVPLHPPPLPVEPQKLRNGLSGLRMVINPSTIPPEDTLLLTARLIRGTHNGSPFQAVGMSMGLYRGAVPACRS
jgi:hypothetical protein